MRAICIAIFEENAKSIIAISGKSKCEFIFFRYSPSRINENLATVSEFIGGNYLIKEPSGLFWLCWLIRRTCVSFYLINCSFLSHLRVLMKVYILNIMLCWIFSLDNAFQDNIEKKLFGIRNQRTLFLTGYHNNDRAQVS